MHALIARLYPICRSLTGDGVRETLRVIAEYLDIDIREVPTGTPVFDWVVPQEWRIADAFIANSRGERIVDFRRSNLHVMGYSGPVRARMSLEELMPHLHSDPAHPDVIPYRTGYYSDTWGFCLPHRQLLALEPDDYDVCILSELAPGSLTYGEVYLPGETEDEVLFSCHVCHPSLCNDNLSAVAVQTFLARAIAGRRRHHSYRFLFVPALIGPLTWLAHNEARLRHIRHGLVLACVGDAGQPTYKRSRRDTAEIDRAVEHVLKSRGAPCEIRPFSPYGYDERQYGSPGIDLPVGCLMRTPHGEFPEYHTSADDLSLVQPEALAGSLEICLAVADVLDGNRAYMNLSPKGEPQLGRRGLYSSIGAQGAAPDQMSLLWTLNLSDGSHRLLDIAERAALPFHAIKRAADALEAAGLLQSISAGSEGRVS